MATAKRVRSHARIHHDEVVTPAWRSLSTDACALLIWIRVNGRRETNGKEKVTIRQVKDWLHAGHARAANAMYELADRGFIAWTNEQKRGQARTFRRTDAKAGDSPASYDFYKWEPPGRRIAGQEQSSTAGMSNRFQDIWPRSPETRKIH